MTPQAISEAYKVLGFKTAKQSAAFVLASLLVAEKVLSVEDLAQRTGLNVNTVRTHAAILTNQRKIERVRIRANRYGFKARFTQSL